MTHNCNNCKFHDVEYEWDYELDDEIEIESCRKGHGSFLRSPFKCPHFEKYEPEPYVEKFTECDKCEYVKSCESNGYVLNCTTSMDSQEHYIKGRNANCRKEKETLENKKLSEIIEIIEYMNFLQPSGSKKLLQKAIEKFGDITYAEFIENKISEMGAVEFWL